MVRSSGLQIGAVVLAAGMSVRMGQPKMILPWRDRTIISQVVFTMSEAKLHPIVVVTGKYRELIVQTLSRFEYIDVYNPDYGNGEMLLSLQLGLIKISKFCNAILVVLGDQPQIEISTVNNIVNSYSDTGHQLIIPSYQKRRGHPWLIGKKYWQEIIDLKPPQTLHDFINKNESNILYLNNQSETILFDIDTPDEYNSLKPNK